MSFLNYYWRVLLQRAFSNLINSTFGCDLVWNPGQIECQCLTLILSCENSILHSNFSLNFKLQFEKLKFFMHILGEKWKKMEKMQQMSTAVSQ